MTYLILDGDMLLFQVMSALETDVQLEEEVWTRHARLDDVRQEYFDRLEELANKFDTSFDKIYQCFTSISFFRKEVEPEYKANRKGFKKPIGYLPMKQELLLQEMAMQHDMIEADDLLGIIATELRNDDQDYIIVSGDKDLLQIPGKHYWFGEYWSAKSKVKLKDWFLSQGMEIQESGVFTIPERAARLWWLAQILIGDTTDNIVGCPSVGEVRALAAVSKFNPARPVECWKEVVQLYREKGKVAQPHQCALKAARLTRILRTGEYDFSTAEVSLWNPPIALSVS